VFIQRLVLQPDRNRLGMVQPVLQLAHCRPLCLSARVQDGDQAALSLLTLAI